MRVLCSSVCASDTMSCMRALRVHGLYASFYMYCMRHLVCAVCASFEGAGCSTSRRSIGVTFCCSSSPFAHTPMLLLFRGCFLCLVLIVIVFALCMRCMIAKKKNQVLQVRRDHPHGRHVQPALHWRHRPPGPAGTRVLHSFAAKLVTRYAAMPVPCAQAPHVRCLRRMSDL